MEWKHLKSDSCSLNAAVWIPVSHHGLITSSFWILFVSFFALPHFTWLDVVNQKSNRCYTFGPDGNASDWGDNTWRKIKYTPVGFWVLSCVSTDVHVCSAMPLLSGPAHNGVPLFHLGCFIRPTEGNGSTSSAHMASHSCSASLNLSQRGWACGIGWRLLCFLEAGRFWVLSQLQGQHIQRKTANNLLPHLKHYAGLLLHLLLAVSLLLLSICLFF